MHFPHAISTSEYETSRLELNGFELTQHGAPGATSEFEFKSDKRKTTAHEVHAPSLLSSDFKNQWFGQRSSAAGNRYVTLHKGRGIRTTEVKLGTHDLSEVHHDTTGARIHAATRKRHGCLIEGVGEFFVLAVVVEITRLIELHAS